MKVQELTNRPYGISYKLKLNVKYKGLYQEQKNLGEALFQKLRANEFAMDFIKKRNNVQIIFDAVKDELNKVESTIKIYYDDPSKGQFRNLVDRIFF